MMCISIFTCTRNLTRNSRGTQNDVIELARNIQGDKLQKVKDFLSVEHEEFYRQFAQYQADILIQES